MDITHDATEQAGSGTAAKTSLRHDADSSIHMTTSLHVAPSFDSDEDVDSPLSPQRRRGGLGQRLRRWWHEMCDHPTCPQPCRVVWHRLLAVWHALRNRCRSRYALLPHNELHQAQWSRHSSHHGLFSLDEDEEEEDEEERGALDLPSRAAGRADATHAPPTTGETCTQGDKKTLGKTVAAVVADDVPTQPSLPRADGAGGSEANAAARQHKAHKAGDEDVKTTSEQWIAQRGTFVRVDADGVRREATDSQTRRHYARVSARRAAATTATSSNAGNSVESSMTSRTLDDSTSLRSAMDRQRTAIQSFEQLSHFLDRCRGLLPVDVSAAREEDGSDAPVNTPPRRTAFALTLQGPLRPSATPDLLSLVEDVLLDDCDEDCLVLSSLTCADLSLSFSSSASLISLSELHNTDTAATQQALCLRECQTRVLVLLRNVMESRARDLHTLRLTRCEFAPFDLDTALPLRLCVVRRLLFDQCPLTGAHVDALVRRAVRETDEQREAASTHAAAMSPDACTTALQQLQELQLSGNITSESVAELLDYMEDEVGGQTALRVLRLPAPLHRAAHAHRFFVTRPSIAVLPTAN